MLIYRLILTSKVLHVNFIPYMNNKLNKKTNIKVNIIAIHIQLFMIDKSF